ncbi:hypothetical protein MPSEU_000151200 [Mayamaea pseudoterrestris]|nr:hypothetical protein MPSEU_000151200 [Mayamaea pseudoterrestris]
MKNSYSFQSTESSSSDAAGGIGIAVASRILYLVFLLAAALAGRYRYRTIEALELVKNYTRSALQLHTMAVIEDMEAYVLDLEAMNVETKAEEEAGQARRYSHDAQVEKELARREQRRSDYFEQLAQQEYTQAHQAKQRVQHDELLYEKLIANMSATEREVDELHKRQQKLRPVHQGLCGTNLFSAICNAVEGAVDLQRQADQESLEIHQDLQLLQKQEKRKETLFEKQFMDGLVAQAFSQQASRYNETSEHLKAMAMHFENQSRVFHQESNAYNASAEYLVKVKDELLNEEEREEEWEVGNESLAERRMREGHDFYKLAQKYATVACHLAMSAFLFFGSRALLHAWYLGLFIAGRSKASNSSSARRNPVSWRNMSYCVIHGVLFFACLGVVHKYLINMSYYDWGQRAAIIAWFAYVAASVQMFALHILPYVLAGGAFRQVNAQAMAKQEFVHLVTLFCLFGIEFLLLWVAAGPWLQLVAVSLKQTVLWSVAGSLIVMHLYLFEPAPRGSSAPIDDLIVNTSQNGDVSQLTVSWSPSETTPLTNTSSCSAATEPRSSHAAMLAFALLDLGPLAREEEHLEGRVLTLLSFTEMFRAELYKLHLPFEILIVTCATKVLFTCFPIAWQYTVVFCTFYSLLLLVVLVWQGLIEMSIYESLQSASKVPNKLRPTSFIELQQI